MSFLISTESLNNERNKIDFFTFIPSKLFHRIDEPTHKCIRYILLDSIGCSHGRSGVEMARC